MFSLLSNGAKVLQNKVFLLKFVPHSGSSRFCFSVSKKVAKNAVVRNRLRREGYRALNNYIPDIKSNILAVFSFKIVPKNYEEFIKNLESILNDSFL